MHRPRLRLLVSVLTLLALAASPVAAQTWTWTGTGLGPPNFNGTTWSNPYNWSPNAQPTPGNSTVLTFNSGAVSVDDLGGTFVLNSLSFNAPITLSGNPLNFLASSSYAPSIYQNAAAPVTITNNLSLPNVLSVAGLSTSTLTLSGVLSGVSGPVISTNSIVVLSNSGNSYSGITYIQNGTLRTDASGALPAGRDVTIQTGTLNLNGTNQTIGNLILSDPFLGANPAAIQTGGGTLTLGGVVTYLPVVGASPGASITGNLSLGTATRTFNIGTGGSATDLSVSALISGSGGLTKSGTGVLALANGNNSYSGGTIIQGGTLRTDALTALPTGGNVAVQAGTLNINGLGQVFGNLTLSDPSTTGASPAPVVTGGSGVSVSGNVTYNPAVGVSPGASILTNIGLTGATSAFNIGLGSSQYDTVINGTVFSQLSGLTKTGIGSLVLAGGTFYSGPTTLTSGNLYLAATNVLNGGGFIPAVVVNGGDLNLITQVATQGVTAGSYDQLFGSLAGTAGNVFLGSATLTVGSDNTSTSYVGTIASIAGALIKVGAGTLALSASNPNLAANVTVNGGVLAISTDSALGAAGASFNVALTVNPAGTLRYTANATTSRTFNLAGGSLEAPTGVTLTLNYAAVNGGFLHGAGTFAINGSVLSGVTTFAATTISVTGPATFVNFSNGSALSVAAGLASPVTMSQFTEQGSGSITIGANSSLNVTDFQSYGTLTLTPATVGGKTLLTNTGSSPLYFNGGSRTFIGVAGGNAALAGIELNGQNAIVAGGLFVNNGHVTDDSAAGVSTVIADYGALVKGGGQYDNSPLTRNGGKFQAGNSPGVATVGRFIFGPGGVSNYVFAIDDATGQAGPTPDALGHVSGWGLVKAAQWQGTAGPTSGDFVWTADAANPLTVAIDTLLNPTTVGIDVPGVMADFDPTRSYSWPAVEWTGTYSGPTDVAALDAATNFDTSGFANPINGTFGWSLDATGQALSLTYSPSTVPEPGTLGLVGFAMAGLALRVGRRLHQVASRRSP